MAISKDMQNQADNKRREASLTQWLSEVLDTAPPQLNVVSGDASFRRYFRLIDKNKSWIAVDAPPTTEKNSAFVKVAQLLSDNQINVPEVIQADYEQGFLLLSDLGDKLLFGDLNENTADTLYSKAIALIVQMQLINDESLNTFPVYDQALLQTELNLFLEWFINKHLSLSLSNDQKSLVNELFKTLIKSATLEPHAFTHRDFHSRNIMMTDKSLATIDFQDAVIGPISYDLVSLIKDCYIVWPSHKINQWLKEYFQLASQQKAHPLSQSKMTFSDFERAFDFMGMQRHLKVLGIFCRLNYRDDKPSYLNDLPAVFNYISQVLKKYPCFADFYSFWDCTLRPAFETKQ